jgi:hypothetical protein
MSTDERIPKSFTEKPDRPNQLPDDQRQRPERSGKSDRWLQVGHVTLGISVFAAKSIGSAATKAARQMEPFVERGAETILRWSVAGLKASAAFLDDVHKKFEQKAKK